jgi:hypothetical protein
MSTSSFYLPYAQTQLQLLFSTVFSNSHFVGRSWEHGVPAITDIYHAPRPQVRDIFSASAAAAGAAAIASGLRPFPERPPMTVSPPHFHLPTTNNNALNSKAVVHNNVANNKNVQNYEESSSDNNWEDDFADGALSFQIAAQGFREQEDEVSKTIRAMPSTAAGRHQPYTVQAESPGGSDMGDDDFEDDAQDLRLKIKMRAMEVQTLVLWISFASHLI